VAAAAPMPLRRPPAWPPDTEAAMLAATYLKGLGKGVAFALAAFRQAYAGGRDLGARATLHLAGAACETHPLALDKGLALRSTAATLSAAGDAARAAGAAELPAILAAGGAVFSGPDCLEAATSALAS
jgi:2-hydroxychromene-2-carboxylate isomerase